MTAHRAHMGCMHNWHLSGLGDVQMACVNDLSWAMCVCERIFYCVCAKDLRGHL